MHTIFLITTIGHTLEYPELRVCKLSGIVGAWNYCSGPEDEDNMTRLHEAQQLETGDPSTDQRTAHNAMFWLDGRSLEEGGEELGSVSMSQESGQA